MSNRYVIEALLRPAVELNTAVVSGMAAYVCVQAPWAVALAPSVSYVTAAGFAALAVTRTHQGMKIIRYRRNLRRLPRYVMSTKQIPVSHRRLFLGRGFRWTQKHTQRLQDTLRPEVARYLQPNRFYQGARQLELLTEHRLPWLGKLLSADTPLNPVRPLPPVGGNPALHGIEPDEKDVTLALGERVGHTVVYGTTRVGKTRLAELLVTQDIPVRGLSARPMMTKPLPWWHSVWQTLSPASGSPMFIRCLRATAMTGTGHRARSRKTPARAITNGSGWLPT